MARIPLYNAPEQLNTGTRVLQPAQFEIADSSLAKGLAQVAGMAGDLAISLNRKEQEMDDATMFAEFDKDTNAERLRLLKYRTENRSNENLPQWDQEAINSIDRIREKYEGKVRNPETQLKINSAIERWSNNLLTETYVDRIDQKSQNFESLLNVSLNNANKTGDFTGAYAILEASKDIFTTEAYSAKYSDLQTAERQYDLRDFNYRVNSMVNMGNYKEALRMVDETDLISDTQKEDKRVEIQYNFQYKDTLNKYKSRAEYEPSTVIRDLTEMKTQTESVDDIATNFVRGVEGFWETAQSDGSQFSVGYGTKAKYEGEKITKEEADRRLKEELDEAARYVDSYGLSLNPNQRAALISYTFNTGPGSVKDGTGLARLIQRLNDEYGGDVNRLPEVISTGVKTGKVRQKDGSTISVPMKGLENRRKDEAKLAATPYVPQGVEKYTVALKEEDRGEVLRYAQSKSLELSGRESDLIKQRIDIGYLNDDTTFETQLLASPNIRPEDRDALRLYRQGKKDKALVDHPDVVAGLVEDINLYSKTIRDAESRGEDADPNKLNGLALIRRIDLMTTGGVSTRLKGDLDAIMNNTDRRAIYEKTSTVRNLLQTNLLGQTETQMMAKREKGWFKKTVEEVPLFKKRIAYDKDGKEIEMFDEKLLKTIDPAEKEKIQKDYETIMSNVEAYLRANPQATADDATNFVLSNDLFLKYRAKSDNGKKTGSSTTAPPTPSKTTSSAGVTPNPEQTLSDLEKARQKAGLAPTKR